MWERDSLEEAEPATYILLTRQGMSRRAIARALGVGRNTVRKRLTAHAAQRSSPHRAVASKPVRAPRPSKLDPYRENVEKLLERFPDITAQRVLEQLRDARLHRWLHGGEKARPTTSPQAKTEDQSTHTSLWPWGDVRV